MRTRARLLRALLALLEEGPFEALSVRRICAEAGIGYATFFRHYPDKTALLDDLAADEISELLRESMAVLSRDDPYQACVALCRYVAEREALWRTLLTGGAAPILRETFVEQAREIAAVHGEPIPKGDCPLDLRITFAISATIEVLAWWLGQEDPPAIEDLARYLSRLVIEPTMRLPL
ncbi:TetR/AcrR family transcriptional regulator [Pseudenhygromyxa sp. WMMC2535]|uniref:TetR family transcriptional regulator n=1 Tax=Pseudenhygromyxa sp. WMMC2535 TaxID=2712867 RepID=UPI0015575550|nr:TetR/AcrR family transcriptional regulator [Pseudenhygromyxa sp. WMMC2535]